MTNPAREAAASKPLLSIAIPTYRRAALLKDLLASLSGQVTGEPRVELLVSDNASPDETEAVVQEFRGRGVPIVYIRNDVNLGADRNIQQCFERARGKHVLVLGDDDYIVAGGVDRMLELIGAGERYDLIYLRPRSFRLNADVQPAPSEASWPRHAVSDPIRFTKLVTLSGDLLCISTLVVNKERVVSSMPPNLAEMVGSHVLQLAWVFTALRQMKMGLVADDDVIRCGRGRPHGGFNAAKVFVVNYLKAMELWLGPSDTALKESLVGDLAVFWFANWIGMRRQSEIFSTQDSRQLLRVLSSERLLSTRTIRYWVFVLPLVSLPIGAAAAWNRLLMIARRHLLARRRINALRSADATRIPA
jgi:abequosyltransferase